MKKRLSKKFSVLLCALITFLIPLIIWTVWGNTALMVSKLIICNSQIPPECSGLRIVQISDLHNAEFGEGNAVLLQKISEIIPDIIVITGDLVDARHTDIDIALDFARNAIQIAPVYYVTGNHEARLLQYQYSQLKTGLESVGVVVLEDQVVQFEYNSNEVALIGLFDPNFTITGDMLHGVPSMVGTKLNHWMDNKKSYTILLSHRPELFETYVSCGVDLVLSGHAHGGQFRFPLIGGLAAPNQGLFPKYDAGLYTDGSTNMVVSRGIGNSIIPFRFNNRPEIIFVELRSKL